MRAVVVVGGEDRIPQLPELPERSEARAADAQRAAVRTAVLARLVRERHLLHAPALRVRRHENLLQDVEVARRVGLTPQDGPLVEAEAAREIADRDVQTEPEELIQDAAEHVPRDRHVGLPSRHVPRRDRHFRSVAVLPQALHELGTL